MFTESGSKLVSHKKPGKLFFLHNSNPLLPVKLEHESDENVFNPNLENYNNKVPLVK